MSSASAAEGTPESRRLLEDIQNMVQANILLERKFCAISRDQALLCLCEIPSSLLEFSAEYEGCLDDLGSMPNYEHTLEQWGFSWMTSIWQQMLAESFPMMASWPWKKQMQFLVCYSHWKRNIRQSARFHFVEIFAGQGNLSRELLRAGWEGVAVDIRYGPDHNVCHVRGFRMAINAVCETRNQGLVWFGTPCSSFVQLCKYSTGRNITNDWMGDEHRSLAARQGNEFMYVTLLLSVLGSLNGNRWVIEQPCSSCLFQIPIASHVMQLLQAMKAKSYGGAFGKTMLKPLQLWSNNLHVHGLSRDFPDYAIGHGGCVNRDDDGKFTGRQEDLQMSEEYTVEFGRAVEFHMMMGITRRSQSEVGR